MGKKWILDHLGKFWKDNQLSLYDEYYKKKESRDQNIAAHPPWISQEQWATYIDYRQSPETLVILNVLKFYIF